MLLATRSAASCASSGRCSPARHSSVIDLVEAGIAESRDEDALEAFETFEENALAKARLLPCV